MKRHPQKQVEQKAIRVGLTPKDLTLTPMCNTCGWRKGGLDSWDGRACKCGLTSQTFRQILGGY